MKRKCRYKGCDKVFDNFQARNCHEQYHTSRDHKKDPRKVKEDRVPLSKRRKKRLIEMYKDGKGTFRIAKNFDVCAETIRRWLHFLDVDIRPREEAIELLKGPKNPMYGKSPSHKGKKLEEIVGEERAKKIKDKLSESAKRRTEMHFKSGKENIVWEGGDSGEYGPGFTNKLKREIRERDNRRCKICGISQLEQEERSSKKLEIHHIDGDKENHDPNNLITLCSRCHRNISLNVGVRFSPDGEANSKEVQNAEN